MKTTTLLAAAIFFASSATAQQTERVLHFTAISSMQNFQAIADVIRSITDIPQANVDKTEKALSLHGTAGQIALAEWLFTNLDKPTSIPQSGDKYEYRVPDSADDVVRLFYLTNPEVPTGVQEIAIAVNSLTRIPHMYTYNDLRAIAVRGTAEQVNVVEFLFAEMDKPAVQHTPSQHLQSAASPEFRMNQAPENLVRVFFVPNIKTFQDFQEVYTLVRIITHFRYAFAYAAPQVVGVRGTSEQIALAEWLFADLDAASISAARPEPAKHEYQVSPSGDDFVRVFYLAHTATPQRLLEAFLQVRAKSHNAWMCIYNAPSATVVRGTAEEIALADRLIQEHDK